MRARLFCYIQVMTKRTWVNFYKIIPGGNPTLLFDAAGVSPKDRVAVANLAMSDMHLGAEQAGFITWPDFLALQNYGPAQNCALPKLDLPKLDMMGGEFCGNAARAYAAALALEVAQQGLRQKLGKLLEAKQAVEQNKDELALSKVLPDPLNAFAANFDQQEAIPLKNFSGQLMCSGLADPISFFVQALDLTSGATPDLASCVKMDAAIEMPLGAGCQIEPLDNGGALVSLPGISHILLPGHLYPDRASLPELANLAKNWRSELDLEQESGVGCIWFDFAGQQTTMRPLVYVKATNSLCLETACGSGAVALALFMGLHLKKQSSFAPFAPEFCLPSQRPPYADCAHAYALTQPSNEKLWVAYNCEKGRLPQTVWLGGPCRIAGKGSACLCSG